MCSLVDCKNYIILHFFWILLKDLSPLPWILLEDPFSNF